MSIPADIDWSFESALRSDLQRLHNIAVAATAGKNKDPRNFTSLEQEFSQLFEKIIGLETREKQTTEIVEKALLAFNDDIAKILKAESNFDDVMKQILQEKESILGIFQNLHKTGTTTADISDQLRKIEEHTAKVRELLQSGVTIHTAMEKLDTEIRSILQGAQFTRKQDYYAPPVAKDVTRFGALMTCVDTLYDKAKVLHQNVMNPSVYNVLYVEFERAAKEFGRLDIKGYVIADTVTSIKNTLQNELDSIIHAETKYEAQEKKVALNIGWMAQKWHDIYVYNGQTYTMKNTLQPDTLWSFLESIKSTTQELLDQLNQQVTLLAVMNKTQASMQVLLGNLRVLHAHATRLSES